MDGRITKAMRLLEEMIGEDIEYRSIASAVGLSFHRFHHLFSEETGETPGSYIRRIRLDAAAMRLRWTRETVGHIARALGYESQSAFNTAFEKRFGLPPGRFRKEHVRWPKVTDEGSRGRVTIRESQGFHGVAKKYLGLSEVHRHWADFLGSLPKTLERCNSLYLGIIHRGPRSMPAAQLRYDCCITTSESAEGSTWLRQDDGFEKLVTRAGLYACIERLNYEMSNTCATGLVSDSWLDNSGYALSDDPTIALYAAPPRGLPEVKQNFILLLAVRESS